MDKNVDSGKLKKLIVPLSSNSRSILTAIFWIMFIVVIAIGQRELGLALLCCFCIYHLTIGLRRRLKR